MKTIDELQEELKKVLKRRRYIHTVGVRYTAQSMAMRFGVDIEKAGYAGVLHDCAKNLSDEQMLLECKKNNIRCSETELLKPSLLHAKLGALYAGKIYGITDEQVISAIRWHTTGKPSMSDLEKVVYIADYIEPGRRMLPHMTEIHKMAFMDLDKTMFLILDNTLSY
ncbi:MAG: bis(5'-nucleosyl)-tetraphosphatase (symmetrical) YqeK, partial [Lachnospiraceae bacterium]|nr:bis(5'-nucleosyl)-tetraphosphatase (symmetrical) YqeK [Lachnospiraceae bacterium]